MVIFVCCWLEQRAVVWVSTVETIRKSLCLRLSWKGSRSFKKWRRRLPWTQTRAGFASRALLVSLPKNRLTFPSGGEYCPTLFLLCDKVKTLWSINTNKLTLLAEASLLTTSICLVPLGDHHWAHLTAPCPYQTTAGLIRPSLASRLTRVDVQGLQLCSHLSPWAPSGRPGPHLQLHQSQSLMLHHGIGIHY